VAKHNNQGGVTPPSTQHFMMITDYKKASFLCSLIGDDDALYSYSIQISFDENERKELLNCITNLSNLGKSRNTLNLQVVKGYPSFNQDAVDYLVQFFTNFLLFTDNLELARGYSEHLGSYSRHYYKYNKKLLRYQREQRWAA
jgi:hypothetical protein